MKALQYSKFGGPEVLAINEVAESHANAGEVRVHVTAVGLNPMDWGIMSNEQLAAQFKVQLPASFGYDYAGVVDEVGANTADFKVGDHVFGTTYEGAAAEYIVLDTEVSTRHRVFHTPAGINDEVAATLGVAGLTAMVALRTINLQASDTVVIGGAAGGVGVFAIQLAKAMGAKVIGTASESTFDFLRQFDVEPVAYGDGLLERLQDKGLTAVVDLVNMDTLKVGLELGVKPEKMTTIIMFPAPPAGIRTSTGGAGTLEDMQFVNKAVSEGKITVPLAGVYPLAQYKEAIAQQMSHHTHGKIVLDLTK